MTSVSAALFAILSPNFHYYLLKPLNLIFNKKARTFVIT